MLRGGKLQTTSGGRGKYRKGLEVEEGRGKKRRRKRRKREEKKETTTKELKRQSSRTPYDSH